MFYWCFKEFVSVEFISFGVLLIDVFFNLDSVVNQVDIDVIEVLNVVLLFLFLVFEIGGVVIDNFFLGGDMLILFLMFDIFLVNVYVDDVLVCSVVMMGKIF